MFNDKTIYSVENRLFIINEIDRISNRIINEKIKCVNDEENLFWKYVLITLEESKINCEKDEEFSLNSIFDEIKKNHNYCLYNMDSSIRKSIIAEIRDLQNVINYLSNQTKTNDSKKEKRFNKIMKQGKVKFNLKIHEMLAVGLNALNNKESAYNQRVSISFDKFKKRGSNLSLKFTIKDVNGNVIDTGDAKYKKFDNPDNITEDLIHSVYNLFVNGEYITPYEMDHILDIFNQKKTAYCEECGEDFNGDLNALINHLLETGHKDSLLIKYEKYFATVTA